MIGETRELRHTRVIVISGRDFPSDRQSAEEAGVTEFLLKPIELTKLIAMLEKPAPVVAVGTAVAQPTPEPSSKPVADQTTRVKFWGVRGSIPTPGQSTVFFGGNTACVEVRAEGEVIILDAGSGIRPLGEAL